MASNAVARETLFALRETIARLEGKPVPALSAAEHDRLGNESAVSGRVPSGEDAALERCCGSRCGAQGGFPLNALTEIRSSSLRDAGAATGFVLALAARLRARDNHAGVSPVLWIGETMVMLEAGLPYALGLQDFGVMPRGFLHAAPRKLEEALWLAEEALASAVFTLVVLEVRGNPAHFGLTESRRLSLRAKAAGRPLFVLRQAGLEEASSALLRLHIEPALASARPLPDGSMLGGSIGNPSFRLTLEKSRNPAPLSFVLEWNAHDRQFFPVNRQPTAVERPAAHSGPHVSPAVDRSDRPQALGSVVAYHRAS